MIFFIERVSVCDSENNYSKINGFHSFLWCVEALFRSNGKINGQNMNYGALENSHWMQGVIIVMNERLMNSIDVY